MAAIQKKILAFFAENPGSIDTPRGVSTWIGEPLATVRWALEDLAERGRLRAHRTPSTIAYSLGRKAPAKKPKGRPAPR